MGDVGRQVGGFLGQAAQINPAFAPAAATIPQIFNTIGMGTGIDGYEVDRSIYAPTAEEKKFAEMLQLRASGQGGPSPAELQMQRALGQGQAQAQSMAASQRGIAPGLAARLAQQQQGQMAQDIAGQSGVLRAQEQLGAQEIYGRALESQRQTRLAGEEAQRSAYDARANRAGGIVRGIGSALTSGAMGGFAYGGAVMDSPKNDVVPAMLSPGEIVIPKSVVQMGPEASAQFVAALSRYVK